MSAFIKISEQVGYEFKLLKEVQRINADQMDRFVKKITDTLWVLKDKTIGVLGLAFKQNRVQAEHRRRAFIAGD